MIVALYLRVSSDEQERSGTIETQREELLQYCERERLTVGKVYEDDGYSTTVFPRMEDRPDGKALIQAVERGEVRTLVIWKLDRLARDAFHILATVSFLTNHKVKLLSPNEEYADDPTGFMMTGIRAVFAQYERDEIRRRTLAGKNRIARSGNWWGGPLPLGYQVGEDFPLVPSSKASIAEQIFIWAGEERFSLNQIRNRLEALGIPPTRGKRWHSGVIRDILINPTYRGELIYGRSGAASSQPIILKVPAIVSSELWHAAQETLAMNKADKSGNPSIVYELAGIMRCYHCGAPYSGGMHGSYSYYTCRNKGRCSHSRSMRKELAEKLIWSRIEKFIKEPNKLLDELTQRNKRVDGDDERRQTQLKILRTNLDSKRDERQQAIALCTRRIITQDDLAKQIERISSEEQELKEQIEMVEADMHRAAIVEAGLFSIEKALQKFRDGDLSLTTEGRKRLINIMVTEIQVETTSPGDLRGRNASWQLHTTFIFEALTGQNSVREVPLTRRCSGTSRTAFLLNITLKLVPSET